MNTPSGFTLADSKVLNVDPVAAMLNPSAAAEVLHMLLAAYMAVGIAVAGIHARLLLRNPGSHFHQAALTVALSVGLVPALLQPIAGDYAARVVARTQPAKLAALEGQFSTETRAPLRIGGIPDARTRTTRMAVEIPGGLSLLAYGDRDATVIGLSDIPRDRWPPVLYVHLAFQVMVAIGSWLALLAGVTIWMRWRGRLFDSRPCLWLLVVSTPLGVIAIEAGWTVTELGRQPWIIQGVMRTSEAVTPVSGLTTSLAAVAAIYGLLTIVVVRMMRRQVFATQNLTD
jgi:cytochrome d ubiquinol oxidase subunit I